MKTKKVFVKIMNLALFFVVAFVFAIQTKNVSASDAAPSYKVTDGASIRTSNPNGIRFSTMIKISEYESFEDKKATFGSLIIPENILGSNELTKDTDKALNVIAEKWEMDLEDDLNTTDIDESEYYRFNVVVVGSKNTETGAYEGFPEQLYDTKLVVKSYVTYNNGEEITEYADGSCTRSLVQVASRALLDETAEYEADEITYFKNIVTTVATKNAQEHEINTADSSMAKFTMPTGCGDVLAILVGTNLVDTTNYNIDNGELEFTKAYAQTLVNGINAFTVITEETVFNLNLTVFGGVEDTSVHTIKFDTTDDLAKVAGCASSEWLASYEGAVGVVKLGYGSSLWNGFFFKAMEASDYATYNWDYIDMRVYIKASSATAEVYMPGGYYGPKPKTNEWVNIRLYKSKIEGTVTGFDQLFSGNAYLFTLINTTDFEGLYVDYFDLLPYDSVEDSGKTLGFDSETDVNKTSLSSTWLKEYEGASGVLKTTANTSVWTHYAFNLGVTASDIPSWNYLVIRMLVSGAQSGTTINVNYFYNDGQWDQIPVYTTLEAGEWTLVYISKEQATKWGGLEEFYSRLGGNSEKYGYFTFQNATGDLYIDYFDFVENIEVENSNKTLGFDSSADISKVNCAGGQQWLLQYKGASGVIMANCGGSSSNGYKFDLGLTKEEFLALDWDYIEIRVYLDDVYYENDTTGTFSSLGENLNLPKQVQIEKWTTLRFLSKSFVLTHKTLDEFYSYIDGTNPLFMFSYTGEKDIHFDYITFCTYEDDVEMNFNDSGDVSYVNNSNATWEASYTDKNDVTANGVVHVTYDNETWAGILNKTMVSYEYTTFDSVRVRILIKGVGSEGHESQGQAYYNGGYGSWINVNEWTEITIPGNKLTSDMLSANNAKLIQFCNFTATDIYVDFIDVIPVAE